MQSPRHFYFLTRRSLLGGLVGGLAAAVPSLAEEKPMTGEFLPELKSFDETVRAFMQKRKVPGGALAVVRDGRLVYARGYGYADRETRAAVQPTTLFRIASISKPITGVAMLRLAQEGRIDLDGPAFDLLKIPPHPEPGQQPDSRLKKITVRHLLQHTAGFDREKSGDPMFQPLEIAKAGGTKPPADPHTIIRTMRGRPLDFDPGTRYAYSNFGYCVLGRLIEKVTGSSYEEYVRRQLLAPFGIRRMRIGHSLLRDRARGETHYYQPNAGEVAPVFPEEVAEKVPWPYGGFNLEAMDAHGGWIASAVDLARFAACLDVPPPDKPLLNEKTTREL